MESFAGGGNITVFYYCFGSVFTTEFQFTKLLKAKCSATNCSSKSDVRCKIKISVPNEAMHRAASLSEHHNIVCVYDGIVIIVALNGNLSNNVVEQ